jgi:C4-dicarboxylate transporter DctM subunit
VITIGGVMYPALIKAKYPEQFSAGLLTSAGTLGIIIPPSIPMIVYAIFASGTQVIQVEDLFLAGIGPGFLIGGFLALYCLFNGLLRGEKFHKSELNFVETLIDGFWSLMLPVIILGGIYTGIFTATEAAAISVVYSLIVEIYIHRSLTLKDLVPVIGESTVLMGSLLIILTMAVGLNDLLAELELPEKAVAWIKQHELTPTTFMLYLNVFLLIVGCFMDIMSAIMILVPLITPMAVSYGIDPIHLGIVFIVNLELGYLTPPMGLNLFVASSLFKKSMGEMIKSVLPFILILFIALMTITYMPTIALGPVNYIKNRPVYVPFPSEQKTQNIKEEQKTDPKIEQKGNDAPKVKSIQEMMQENGLDDEDE